MDNRDINIKRRGIKAQLRAILAVLIVVPIVILGIYVYVVAKNNLIEQTKIAIEGNTDVVAGGLENSCQREMDVVKFLTYEGEFRRRLEFVQSNKEALEFELKDNIEPLVWYYLGNDNGIESVMFYSELPDGQIGAFLRNPDSDNIKKWYDICRADSGAFWVTDDDGGVYLVKALLDVQSSSKLIGMVVLKVRTETFFASINNTDYMSNGAVVLDINGNVVFHKGISDEKLDKEIVSKVKEYNKTRAEDEFWASDKYFISSSKRLQSDWILYSYIDRSEIVTDIASILLTDIIIAVVLFVLAYLVATLYANNISAKLDKLNGMAGNIRSGNFNVKDDIPYKDEIGMLSDSMVDMAGQLKSMVEEINKRNEQDLLMKETDIHYREWLFDFVVEKNNDILAVLDEVGYKPSFITSNIQEVLGISQDEIEEDIRNIDKALRKDIEGVPSLAEAIDKCRSSGGEIFLDEIKLENTKTNEHLYYRGALICTIDDGGKRLAIALYDRTQEFRRNHQLQEALNAAETANKAKTSFLANMSHDFRTPMNAITGFNLLIDKHSEEPEKVREYTHKISLASQNLLSLLNDVLDMSKIESGKTTLDINEMGIGLLLEEINSVIYKYTAIKEEFDINSFSSSCVWQK